MTVIGLILVAIGVIALLARLEIISGSLWGYIWPSILIILGLWFVIRWWWGRRWWWDFFPRDRRRDRPPGDG